MLGEVVVVTVLVVLSFAAAVGADTAEDADITGAADTNEATSAIVVVAASDTGLQGAHLAVGETSTYNLPSCTRMLPQTLQTSWVLLVINTTVSLALKILHL